MGILETSTTKKVTIECFEKLSRPEHLDSREFTAIAQQLLGQCYQHDDALKPRSLFGKSIINLQKIRISMKDVDEFNISMSYQFAQLHKLLVSTFLNLEENEAAVIVSDRSKAQTIFDLSREMTNRNLTLLSNSSDLMETIANPVTKTLKQSLHHSFNNLMNSNQAETIISYTFGENGELHLLVISQGQVFYKERKNDGETSMRNYLSRRTKASKSVKPDPTSHDLNFDSKMSNLLVLLREEEETTQNETLANASSRSPRHLTKSSEQTAYEGYMKDLYNVLIQPIEQHLSGSRLLIVPEGPLLMVPFAALLDPDGNYLCEKYSLQFTPSLHILDFCSSKLSAKDLGPALFVGNCLSDLPFEEHEVVECSQYFKASPLVQRTATKKNVVGGVKTASIIHIAAHGSMIRANICVEANDNRLPTSAEDTTSYILISEDVKNCSLKARLVVLSCCHNGCDEISAEDVVGNAFSFLEAGARAVVVALWSIPDEATKEFMVEFYWQILQENSVSVALQQAMITMKIKYPPNQWAAFQVIGKNVVFTRQDIEEIRQKSTDPGPRQMAIVRHKEQAENAHGNGEKARAFKALGTDYELVYEYDKALCYYKKFLEIGENMNDIEKAQASVNMARLYLLEGEYNKVIEFSKTAERLGDKSMIARANSVMGCAYMGRGEYEKAIEKIHKEMDNTETNDKLGIVRAKGNLGKAYIGADDYHQAPICIRQHVKLAQEIKDKREQEGANENFGNYLAAIGEFNEALLKYKQFSKIVELVGDVPGIGRANGCIGAIYTEMGSYKNAVKYHEKERRTAKKLKNKVCEGHALGNLANAYAGLGKYKEAIKLHEESVKIAEECDVIADKIRAYRNIRNAYMASGEYHRALDHQKRALKIAHLHSHKAAEGRIHESMSRTYYLCGRIEEAVGSCKKALVIADEVVDKIGKGELLELWIKLIWS